MSSVPSYFHGWHSLTNNLCREESTCFPRHLFGLVSSGWNDKSCGKGIAGYVSDEIFQSTHLESDSLEIVLIFTLILLSLITSILLQFAPSNTYFLTILDPLDNFNFWFSSILLPTVISILLICLNGIANKPWFQLWLDVHTAKQQW